MGKATRKSRVVGSLEILLAELSKGLERNVQEALRSSIEEVHIDLKELKRHMDHVERRLDRVVRQPVSGVRRVSRKAKTPCQTPGCARPAIARGYCSRCYQKNRYQEKKKVPGPSHGKTGVASAFHAAGGERNQSSAAS
jgi:hypothetical protein